MSKLHQIEITDSSFIALYRPEENDEGGYFRQRDWPEDKELLEEAIDQNRCWTLVDGDNDTPTIVSGHHIVNRIHSYITHIPYPAGYMIDVVDDDCYDAYSDNPWDDNELQFARILQEMEGIGVFNEPTTDAILAVTNLKEEEFHELLDRSKEVWENAVAAAPSNQP